MDREVEFIYNDGVQNYKFFKIKQNAEGEFFFFPSLFNSRLVGTQGNHFTYHENGYYNTTLKGHNGFCLQSKGPKLRPISEFRGVMQVLCLGKRSFEVELLKITGSQRRKNQEVVIVKHELEEIQEPSINILLLEPNRKNILERQKPYSTYLKGEHIIRYFDEFKPWVVLLVGSASYMEVGSTH